MKFFYVAVLFAPAILASAVNARSLQERQVPEEVTSLVRDWVLGIKEKCPQIPSECTDSLDKFVDDVANGVQSFSLSDIGKSFSALFTSLSGAGGCASKLVACF